MDSLIAISIYCVVCFMIGFKIGTIFPKKSEQDLELMEEALLLEEENEELRKKVADQLTKIRLMEWKLMR